jgi:hypothetical protein
MVARDLQDDLQAEAWLRGLHVSTVHAVWGIAAGYDVLLDHNRLGVQVLPGMAYDTCGRELLLDVARRMVAPRAPSPTRAPAWWFDLILRHAAPLQPPTLRWVYATDAPSEFVAPLEFGPDVRLGEDVPLARIRLAADGKITHLTHDLRRIARGLARPRIGGDWVPAGAVAVNGSVWDWTAWIDTSTAGFGGAPCYCIRLADDPVFSPASAFADIFLRSAQGDADLRTLLGPLIVIENVTQAGFTLRVRVAAADEAALRRFPPSPSVGLRLPVPVEWLGIEIGAPVLSPSEGARP